MGGSKIHAHMAQLFVVIHMQEFYHGFAIFFRRGLFGGYVNNLIRITKSQITKNSELNKNGSDFLFQKTNNTGGNRI